MDRDGLALARYQASKHRHWSPLPVTLPWLASALVSEETSPLMLHLAALTCPILSLLASWLLPVTPRTLAALCATLWLMYLVLSATADAQVMRTHSDCPHLYLVGRHVPHASLLIQCVLCAPFVPIVWAQHRMLGASVLVTVILVHHARVVHEHVTGVRLRTPFGLWYALAPLYILSKRAWSSSLASADLVEHTLALAGTDLLLHLLSMFTLPFRPHAYLFLHQVTPWMPQLATVVLALLYQLYLDPPPRLFVPLLLCTTTVLSHHVMAARLSSHPCRPSLRPALPLVAAAANNALKYVLADPDMPPQFHHRPSWHATAFSLTVVAVALLYLLATLLIDIVDAAHTLHLPLFYNRRIHTQTWHARERRSSVGEGKDR